MNEDPTPLVSVVMTTYRGDNPDYVRQAIQSVFDQTHRQLELIIVQDGEVPEALAQTLHECAAHDDRIVLLALSRNQGPAAARNEGIARAGGRYIAILDSDDRALPERLEKQLRFMQINRCDVVGSAYRMIDERGETVGEKFFPTSAEAVRRAMYLFNPIANSTVFARADVLKRHNYPKTYRYGEDYALWVALARQGYLLCNVNEVLVEFRTGASFLSRRRGLHAAITELMTKLACAPMYPVYKRPWVAMVAVAIALARLMPPLALPPLYWLRTRIGSSHGSR